MVAPLEGPSWDEFYTKLQICGKEIGVSSVEIEQGGIRTMATMIQYVEVLMTVYDVDKDNRLSTEEILSAAKRFRGFIRDISPIKNDTFLDEVFLYLIHTGKKPEGQDWKLIANHIWHRGSLPPVEREQIFNVLGILKVEMSKSQMATKKNKDVILNEQSKN